MTRRREIERRVDAVEDSLAQQDDALAEALADDVDGEQVDAVIEASRKHLANDDLDESEQALRESIGALDPV